MSRKTTPTYVLLNQITLAATSSSVTFANIPQGYGDLVLAMNASGTSASRFGFEVYFNSDFTNSNYSRVRMGFETSVYSDSANAPVIPVFTPELGAYKLQVFDYSATDKHKTVLLRQDLVGATSSSYTYLEASAGRWANTSAINSIRIIEAGGESSIASGSTFSIYGIVA